MISIFSKRRNNQCVSSYKSEVKERGTHPENRAKTGWKTGKITQLEHQANGPVSQKENSKKKGKNRELENKEIKQVPKVTD